MSRLAELVAEHCPNGVEYKQLSELATTVPGLSGKSKADFHDGNARFASYRNIFANPALDLEAPDFVKVKEGEQQNSVQRGDILFTGSSESFDEVGMSSVVTAEPSEPIYVNSFCFIVRPNRSDSLEPEFAKHLFRSESIRKADSWNRQRSYTNKHLEAAFHGSQDPGPAGPGATCGR